MLNKFALVAVILQLAWTEQVVEQTGAVSKECTEGQSGDAGKCASGKCVTIGADKICSQCAKTADEAPLNGICQVPSDANICKTKAGGKCTECVGQSFMYQGGCYEQSDAFGQTICTALDAGTAGVCKTCAAGYFKNPTNAGTSDSCIACGDATGVQAGSATYKGVANCAECTPPEAGSGSEQKAAKCTVCTNGKKPNAAGDHCYTCPDEGATAGCSSCSADNTCEACVPGKILKTDGNTKTCVAEAECTAGFFVSTANSVKTCVSCTDNSNGATDCATCEARADDKAKAECLSCTGTKKPKVDGTQCNECDIPGCTNCDAASQCAVCGDGYRHDTNTCQKCTPENCKACTNDAKICTECVEGYTLEGGKCMPPNTNRSALSTGAIAGISVAVIVVVGGLVGFLCWWFICRGKA